MAQNNGWSMPRVLDCPSREGRKPPSIPDTTQFSTITQMLFGVTCKTPVEAYRQGAYNELYLLYLDVPPQLRPTVPRRVLARISRDDKTRSDMSLESEMATMVFLRMRTTIPVPVVYGYCPKRNNIIGQPFSILSFTEGVEMSSTLWEQLSCEMKLTTIRDYARIVLELSELHFDRIGSIYFKPGVVEPPNYFRLGPVTWCKHESSARRAVCAYNRGPWKSSGAWLRASVDEEMEFMEKLPELAQTTYGYRGKDGSRWWQAKRVLPQIRDRIVDVIDDPLDRCANGPFVLGHMDLNPSNILYVPHGPNIGKIVAVIDWEMAMTVPLWALVCHPSWFSHVRPGKLRNTDEAQLFKDTYVRELQKHTSDSFILRVVQNNRSEARKVFATAASLPWVEADRMEEWLRKNPRGS